MEQYKREDCGNWWIVECQHCEWAITLPKSGQATVEVIEDRLAQIEEHSEECRQQ